MFLGKFWHYFVSSILNIFELFFKTAYSFFLLLMSYLFKVHRDWHLYLRFSFIVLFLLSMHVISLIVKFGDFLARLSFLRCWRSLVVSLFIWRPIFSSHFMAGDDLVLNPHKNPSLLHGGLDSSWRSLHPTPAVQEWAWLSGTLHCGPFGLGSPHADDCRLLCL